MKVLHGAQTPLYIAAGLMEEYTKRQEGKLPTPYSDILKESGANLIPWLSDARRRTTYGSIVENKALAFGLDVFGDPITYVPFAGWSKLWKGAGWVTKGAIRTPSRAVVRAADEVLGTKFIKGAEKFTDSIRRSVVPFSDLKHLGGDDLVKRKLQSYRAIEKESKDLGEMIEREINAYVSDIGTKEKIFDLVERRPFIQKGVKLSPDDTASLTLDPEFIRWRQDIGSLAPHEYLAYRKVVEMRNLLEELKIKSHLLSQEQALGFQKSFGIGYLPHRKGTAQSAIDQGKAILAGVKAGDESVLRQMKTWKGRSKKMGNVEEATEELRKWVNEIENIDQITSPEVMERIRRKLPSTHPRIAKGTREEISAVGDALESDVAKVLGGEGRQVGQALASLHHAEALGNWLKKKGYMWDELPSHESLVSTIGKEAADNVVRGGFKRLTAPAVKGISGKHVPRAIADEIEGVFRAYRSPKQMREFLGTYRTVQNIWKAWTLSIFPSYGLRNAFSNLWNNFLAGMGPTSIPHYNKAMDIMWRWKNGTLDDIGKKIIDEATDMRVLRAGQYHGEIGEVIEQQFSRLTRAGKVGAAIFHPAHNPLIKKGFAANTFFEDHARLSHYLWAKNAKGMSMDEAASSVNKYLFDYKYGLTPFEKKAFRDFQAPFYAWTRFNLPLQLEMLMKKPGRFLTMPKGMRALEDAGNLLGEDGWGAPEPNEMFMADWMKRATKLRFRWNADKQTYEYFVLDNWLPSADLRTLFDQHSFRDMVLNLWSPFTKVPVEIMFNYSLFRKRKLKKYPGERRKLLGMKVDPRWIDHPLRTIRLFNEVDRTIEGFYRSESDLDRLSAVARWFVGKVYPYNPVKQQKWWVYNTDLRIRELKGIKKRMERYKRMKEAGVIEGVIEELETERDYYKNLKVGK